MTQNKKPQYPRAASILALAGGIVITLSGLMFMAASSFILPNMNYSNLSVPPNFPVSSIPALVSGIVGVMGAFGLVTGIVVLVSAVMLLTNSGQARTWSVLILVFSVLSFVGLGGFVVGAVLGIVGGALVLKWRPVSQ